MVLSKAASSHAPEPSTTNNKNLWLLSVLVLQNSLAILVGRYNRKAAPEELYNIHHFVLVSEAVKLFLSVLLEVWTATMQRQYHRVHHPLASFRMYLWESPRETLKMAVPASLYWGSNTLLFVALSKLTVPIFQVAYQAKLVITALVSVCFLGRSYDTRQWCCLVVISVSVACIAAEDSARNNNGMNDISESTADEKFHDGADAQLRQYSGATTASTTDISGDLFLGLGAIAVACLFSAFAGVYFEYVVKSDRAHDKTPSLWMRNIQLALFSIIVALVQLKWNEVSENGDDFFHGFTFYAWCQVILFAAGGLLVAAVIQHADNVVKGLATGISVLVSSAGSMVLYKTPFTPTFSICAMATVFATHLRYENYDVMPTEPELEEGQVVERHFHEATHILYDLRTAIGDRRAKYLEIGSYTGISASLMLRHPMPTFVTMVDPCVLDPSHFQGTLTQEETIRKNLNALTNGNSCDENWRPRDLRVGFSPQALPKGETFDIIFIDGDHSTRGVWSDYNGTIDLLRPGGFMVFDDYYGDVSSPEVRPAVDDIARMTDLVAIGSPRNVHGIHPESNISLINEYIFQKKGVFKGGVSESDLVVENPQPLLGIIVASYRRANEDTLSSLENLWKLLLSQSYGNWKLYLTGDYYDNETEWTSLSFFNHAQASVYNLPEPGERGKLTGQDLWNHGGLAAVNNAIDRMIADGTQWAVRLDDDDFWDTDHLQNIVLGIHTGATFVMSECQYKSLGWLPKYSGVLTNISHTILPRPCKVIHSSVAFNAVKLTSRYQFLSGVAADANMWARIIYDDYFYPAFVPVKSCYHVREAKSAASEFVRRRCDLVNRDPPPGWVMNASRYTSLASESFPDNLSSDCMYVVGPQMEPPTNYSYRFAKLPLDAIPYHIRVVDAFTGLPVWGKQ